MSILKLKPTVESLDEVPERYRAFYAPGGDDDDGAFVLDKEIAADIASYASTSTNLRKANKEAAERKALLKEWTNLGVSLEEAKELLAAGQRAPSDDPPPSDPAKKSPDPSEIDRVKAALTKSHTEALAKKDQELTAIRQQLQRTLLNQQATAAISKHQGISRLLLPHVMSAMTLIEENGELHPRILGEDGQVRLNGAGNPMSAEEFVAELREQADFKAAFIAEPPPSGGDSPTGRPAGGRQPAAGTKKLADMGLMDKVEAIREARKQGKNPVEELMKRR